MAAVAGLAMSSVPADAAVPFEIFRRGVDPGYGVNIATKPFVKTTGGTSLSYWCEPGTPGNLQAQITNLNQTHAYRTFRMTCTGEWVDLGSLNTPSRTLLVARVHNYSNVPFDGGVFAMGTGYCAKANGQRENCL